MSDPRPLQRRILMPVDGSELSAQAPRRVARLLAEEGARVELLTAVNPLPFRHTLRPLRPGRDEQLIGEQTARAAAHLRALRGELEARGVDAVACQVTLGDPAQVILDRVEQDTPTLVVMTTHGRSGPSRWVRGSVCERVLRRSPVPVLTLPPIEGDGLPPVSLKRILVPLDGSPRSKAVVAPARQLAALHGAEIILLRVGLWLERLKVSSFLEKRVLTRVFPHLSNSLIVLCEKSEP